MQLQLFADHPRAKCRTRYLTLPALHRRRYCWRSTMYPYNLTTWTQRPESNLLAVVICLFADGIIVARHSPMCASGVFKAIADPVALTLSRNEAPVTALVFRNRCPFRQEIQIKRTRQSDDRIYANNCATPFSWPAIYAGQLSVAMLARAFHFFSLR